MTILPTSSIDHYEILGFSSGEDSLKLTIDEISKSYKRKALIVHPDKNPNDPEANFKFTQLKSSYEILRNELARKKFDDLLKLRREKELSDEKFDAKRRLMGSNLEKREHGWFVEKKAEEDRVVMKNRLVRRLNEEVRSFKMAKKGNDGVERKVKLWSGEGYDYQRGL